MNATLVRVAMTLAVAGCTHATPTSSSGAPAASGSAGATFTDTPAGSASSSTSDAHAARKGTVETKDRNKLAQAAFDEVAPKIKTGEDPSKSLGWGMALTPAFPAVWPPDGSVAVYVYARGRGMRLMDGEHVAAPFARIVSTANGVTRVETLASTLREVGIQGVRPMRKEELATPEATTLETAVRALRSSESPPADDLRASYCQWRKLNGVIAGSVLGARDPAPPAFFHWLGCNDG